MGWSTSNLSGAGIAAMAAGTFYSSGGFVANTINVALYGTTPTPNKDDTLANNAYNAGQWISGNESTATTGYAAGGSALPATKSISEATGTVTAKTTTGTLAWTVTGTLTAYGCLVYDNTITNKYAHCWNYFGGSQSVTGGTFTLTWNASGIYTITIT